LTAHYLHRYRKYPIDLWGGFLYDSLMSKNPLSIEVEVQQLLDELWNEREIPFALNIGKITKDATEYTIYFHDARMRTICVPLGDNLSLRDLVRTAVLARVAKMSGPLKDWHKAKTD
jgi:hypothetical protein